MGVSIHYIVYEVRNKINGKVYIGKHQTIDLEDDYLGSGKLIKEAIDKYGRENFEKKILFVFETEDEMNFKEAELVTEEFVTRDDNYNLCPGGNGGWNYLNSIKTFEERSAQGKKSQKLHPRVRENLKKGSQSSRESGIQTIKKLYGNDYFKKIASYSKSRPHRRKISESLKALGSQEKIKCPWCNKIGGSRSMKRWHFDNCRFSLSS